jgi:hypothetical protein
VAADFNRDGHVDLAMADTYGNDVFVMLGKGDGTFKTGTSFAAGEVPIELALGDFNGDGFTDIAVADGPDCGCGYVSILLGNGDGTFGAPTTIDTASPAGGILVGDFNRDGKADIVFESGALMFIGLGNGDGTFQPFLGYGSDNGPGAMALADFNRDRVLDIVTTNFNGNNTTTVSILLGNGDGTFARIGSYATGQNPIAIVTADFNGDGHKDLATTNNQANTISVLIGKGNGTFNAAVSYPVSSGASSIAIGDFNGDGKPDLVVNEFSLGTVSVLLNLGNGTFSGYVDYPAGSEPVAVATGDFNNDGKIDIVVVGAQGLSLLLGNGNGTFESPISFGSGLTLNSIAVGDFNHDGNLDIAAGGNGSAYVFLGAGNGSFSGPVSYSTQVGWANSIVTADVDGDKNLDLIVAGNEVAVMFGKGDGTFWGPATYLVQGGAVNVQAADIFGGGKLDLAVTTGLGYSNFYVLKNRGYGTFDSPAEYYVGANPGGIAIADFDGNGSQDVAVTNLHYGGSAVTVLLNPPVIALFPEVLKFPSQAVGTTSSPKAATISNPGTARLRMNSISLTGLNAGDFLVTNSCGASLLVGTNCTISVKFKPSATGTRVATLKVTDNALSRTQLINLQGVGK